MSEYAPRSDQPHEFTSFRELPIKDLDKAVARLSPQTRRRFHQEVEDAQIQAEFERQELEQARKKLYLKQARLAMILYALEQHSTPESGN